ncbi:recombinase family protein [Promicromonospora sp. NFX87]|uniref:recombinase family protein n=1 Tax=Promicromonospora sp. NFX87 TaxID=3402691 RepID=UPI003AFA124C
MDIEQRPTVPLYLRISQSDLKEGETISDALDRQEKDCRRLADGLGWRVGETFKDLGISATKGKDRPEFLRLLATKPARAITWHMDRFIRMSAELEVVISTNENMDVRSVFSGQFDLATPAGRMAARQVVAVNQYEGEHKAERQRARNQQLAEQGYPFWRRAPLGHTSKGEKTEHAKSVAWAAKALLDGETLANIARAFDENGVPNPQGAPKWTSVAISVILRSPRIAGILAFKGERMPLSRIEPIISEETFAELQGILSGNDAKAAGGGKARNLLTGLALCGECNDGKTTVRAGKGKYADGRHAKYQCGVHGHNSHRNTRRPDENGVTEGIDEYVVDRTLAVIERGEHVIFSAGLTQPERAELVAERKRLRDALGEWESAGASIGPSEYLRVTQPLRAALSDVEEKLQTPAMRDLLEGLTFGGTGWTGLMAKAALWERWDVLPLARKRAILAAIWESITLLPSHGNRWHMPAVEDVVELVERTQ